MVLNRLSIRWRLSLSVLFGTTLILGAVFLYGFYYSSELLIDELELKSRYLAEATSYRIEARMRVVEKAVEGMVASLELSPPPTAEQIRIMLEHNVQQSGEIYGAAVALNTTTNVLGLGRTSPYVYEHRDDGSLGFEDLAKDDYVYEIQDWYVIPTELQRPVWSEPYYDQGGGDILMVTYSSPFYALDAKGQKQMAGIVTSDVSLEWLTDLLAALFPDETGHAFLLSRNGTFIAHPNKKLILSENIFSMAEERQDNDMRELGRRMVAGASGFVSFMDFAHGEPVWMAYSPVPSTRWTLAALFPKDALMEKVRVLGRAEFAIGVTGFGLLLIVILLIARSITEPVRKLDRAARILASGNLDAPLPYVKGQDEVACLTQSFARMCADLKTYMSELKATVAAKERIESELRIAHDIQMGLVPRTFPPCPNLENIELYALMDPAREVGGDFYDFFPLDDTRFAMAIGDVSGKGVPAALFMAVTRSFLRSLVREEADQSVVMTRLNDELSRDNDACMFVTLFCAVVHLDTGECRFANGGHNPPFIVRADGSVMTLPAVKGVAVGALEGVQYTEDRVTLRSDDTLFVYTDGVTEAMNPDNELFDEERTIASIKTHHMKTCKEMLMAIRDDLSGFASGAEQSDDITMMAFRNRRPSGS